MNPDAGEPLPEANRLLRIPIDLPASSEASGAEALSGEGSFMQSPFWARFKMETGWKAAIARSRSGDESPGRGLVVLARPLALGYYFAYVPHGPSDSGFGKNAGARLESLGASLIDAIGRKLGVKILFLRFDLAWDRAGEAGKDLLASIDGGDTRMRRGTAVQVPDTAILDIEKPEEAILGGMKPKWRYNIKLAEKKGVVVGEEGVGALDVFYSLYGETAKRDGIAIHPLSYYRTLFETGEKSSGFKGETFPKLSLWVARHEGRPIASIITLFLGRHATYLYGASSGEKRNLMPAYALQWRAIQAARAEGCVDYDFFGVPPDDSPDHPMAGLYLFKTGFGGRLEHRVGCVDYPASPLAYRLFRTAEAARLFWYKKIRKIFR